MAKGSPDYFGISVFAQNGPMQNYFSSGIVIPDGGEGTLGITDIKGSIESAFAHFGGLGDPHYYAFQITVDGQIVIDSTVYDFFAYGSQIGLADIFLCSEFAPSSGRYTISLSHKVTIAQSFTVKCMNQSGLDVALDAGINYAKIL